MNLSMMNSRATRSVVSTQGASPRPVGRPVALRRRCAVHVVAEEAAPAVKVGVEKSGPNFKALKDINTIMSTLPHRYPFLLVDRVVEWEHEKFAVGYKCITINDQFFNGHFPGRPIMPGVLQVEAMAQLAGLTMLDPESTTKGGLFFFGGIEGCRFRKPVVPGDVLMMRVDITKNNKRFGIVKAAAKGYVGEDLVVEAELTLAMAKST